MAKVLFSVLLAMATFLLFAPFTSSTSLKDFIAKKGKTCEKYASKSCGRNRTSSRPNTFLAPVPYPILEFLKKQVPKVMPQRGSLEEFSAIWLLEENFADLKTDEFYYIPKGSKGPLIDSSKIVSPSITKGQNYIVARPMDSRHDAEWAIYKEVTFFGALRSYEQAKTMLSYSYVNPSEKGASMICRIKQILKVEATMIFSIARNDALKAQKSLANCGIRVIQLPRISESPNVKNDGDPMPNIGYILHGYNMLYGDPIVDPIEGHDPGVSPMPIFTAVYSGKTTDDKRWEIPDGTSFLNAVSCRIEFTSTECRSEKSYMDSMSNEVGVSSGFFGFEFKASTTIQKKTEELRTATFSYVNSQAVCSSYTGTISQDIPPKLTDEFVHAVKACESDPTDDKKIQYLVETYGTHYLTYVVMGSKFGEESKLATESYEKLVQDGLNVGTAAGYSGAFSAGVSTETDKQKEEREKFEAARTSKTMYTYGSSIPADGDPITWASESSLTPMPINMDVASIADLFTENFMGYTDIDYEGLRPRVVEFLTQYCKLLKDEGKAKDCMPTTEFATDGPGMHEWVTTGKQITGLDMIDDMMALLYGMTSDSWHLKILKNKTEVSDTDLQLTQYAMDLTVCPGRRRLGVLASDLMSWGYVQMYDVSEDGKTLTKGVKVDLQDHGVGVEDLVFNGLSYYADVKGFLLVKKAWGGNIELLRLKEICLKGVTSVGVDIILNLPADNGVPAAALHLGGNIMAISVTLAYQVRKIRVVDLDGNTLQEIETSGSIYYGDMFKDQKDVVVVLMSQFQGYGDGTLKAYRWLSDEKKLEFATDLLTEKSLMDMPSQNAVSVFGNTAYFAEGFEGSAMEYQFRYD